MSALTPLPLDHGVLNVPLSKRGNIDAQIDRYKADQRRIEKQKAADFRVLQARARELVAALPDEAVASIAKKASITVKQAQKKLKAMCRWEPTKVIRILGQKEERAA